MHIAGIPAIWYLQETITQLNFKQRTVHGNADLFFMFKQTLYEWPMDVYNCGAIVIQR